MEMLLSQTGILSVVTIAGILGGMGWFAYKMYILSGKTAATDSHKHSAQH